MGIAIVLLRKTALAERSIIQLLLNNFYFLLFSAVPALLWWHTPNWSELLLLASVGALGGFAQYLLFEGMKRTPGFHPRPSRIHIAAMGVRAWLRDLGRRAAQGSFPGRCPYRRRRAADRRHRAFPQTAMMWMAIPADNDGVMTERLRLAHD